MDKKKSKNIDQAVMKITIDMWRMSNEITEEVLRELEERLIKSIHERWEYEDNRKKTNEKNKF